MKSSIANLRIEPHVVEKLYSAEECYYRGETLWHVFVDDNKLTETCHPFIPSEDTIQLHPNPCYPFFGDGGGFISVRQAGNYILWFGKSSNIYSLEISDYQSYRSGLHQTFIIFEMQHYVKVVENAVSGTSKPPITFGRKLHGKLPSLVAQELEWLLKPSFPKLDDVIYRIPEDENDPSGAKLIQRGIGAVETDFKKLVLIHQLENLNRDGKLEPVCVSDVPEVWIEIRIGLDLFEFTEARWRIGRTKDGELAVQFVSYPSFPLWLCGEVVDKAFAGETFLHDL